MKWGVTVQVKIDIAWYWLRQGGNVPQELCSCALSTPNDNSGCIKGCGSKEIIHFKMLLFSHKHNFITIMNQVLNNQIKKSILLQLFQQKSPPTSGEGIKNGTHYIVLKALTLAILLVMNNYINM